jgi:hypothetical protein
MVNNAVQQQTTNPITSLLKVEVYHLPVPYREGSKLTCFGRSPGLLILLHLPADVAFTCYQQWYKRISDVNENLIKISFHQLTVARQPVIYTRFPFKQVDLVR